MARNVKALPGPSKMKGFIKVAKGIYTYVGGGGATNFGLVLTDDKPVIIDNDIRVRKEFTTGMRKITRKKPGIVLNTHHNFDHTSDNGYYHRQGAVSFAVDIVRQEMEREENAGIWVTQMLGRPQKVDHLVGKLHIAPPMVTFEDRLTVRYGGRTFEMIYIGHCHTRGDTVIWMPEERVLFTGDLLDYRTHPVARLGHFGNWIDAFPKLKKFPARHIIPGHGPIPARAAGVWDEFRGYFIRLRNRTAAALKKEGTPKRAAKAVRLDEYRNWLRSNYVEPNALRIAQELRRGK